MRMILRTLMTQPLGCSDELLANEGLESAAGLI